MLELDHTFALPSPQFVRSLVPPIHDQLRRAVVATSGFADPHAGTRIPHAVQDLALPRINHHPLGGAHHEYRSPRRFAHMATYVCSPDLSTSTHAVTALAR